MIEELRFVHRGVAKRDLIPGLTHFRISNGRVTGFNGTLALSSPLAVSFNAAPLAFPFMKAIDACDESIILVQETPDRLLVRSGRFKAYVPCVPISQVPKVEPEGVSVSLLSLDCVEMFKTLRPFICEDEQRAALQGVLLSGSSAYVTNNVVLVEFWLGTAFPYIANIPVEVIDEVIRTDSMPESLQLTASNVTFHYTDGRWIKGQLNPEKWPDVFRVLNENWDNLQFKVVTQALKAACEKLARFAGRERGNTFFRGNDVATAKQDSADGIALVEVAAPAYGVYHTKYLSAVLKIANEAAFERYPLPVPFHGACLRGVLCGVRET